jgi:hypothetical protein
MTVSLNRPYLGNTAGSIVTLPASTEAALVAQGLAATSAAVPTAGAFTTNMTRGFATIGVGASSVVVTNPNVDATTVVQAQVAQSAADATLLRVERVVSAAGSFTIFGTANATAATVVSWEVLNSNPTVFN